MDKQNKSELVILRMEPELAARINSGAKDAGLNRSEYIRRLIRVAGSVNWDTGVVTLSTDTGLE